MHRIINSIERRQSKHTEIREKKIYSAHLPKNFRFATRSLSLCMYLCLAAIKSPDAIKIRGTQISIVNSATKKEWIDDAFSALYAKLIRICMRFRSEFFALFSFDIWFSYVSLHLIRFKQLLLFEEKTHKQRSIENSAFEKSIQLKQPIDRQKLWPTGCLFEHEIMQFFYSTDDIRLHISFVSLSLLLPRFCVFEFFSQKTKEIHGFLQHQKNYWDFSKCTCCIEN